MVHVVDRLGVSQRRACQVIGQHRSVQRYHKQRRNIDQPLTERIIALASEYGRYGYRRITVLLNREGWHVNHKRVQRIWRAEGLAHTLDTASRTLALPFHGQMDRAQVKFVANTVKSLVMDELDLSQARIVA